MGIGDESLLQPSLENLNDLPWAHTDSKEVPTEEEDIFSMLGSAGINFGEQYTVTHQPRLVAQGTEAIIELWGSFEAGLEIGPNHYYLLRESSQGLDVLPCYAGESTARQDDPEIMYGNRVMVLNTGGESIHKHILARSESPLSLISMEYRPQPHEVE